MKVHSCRRRAILGNAQKRFVLVLEGLRISLETLRLFLDNKLSLGRYHREFRREVGLAILGKEMHVSIIEGFGGEHRLQKKDKRVAWFFLERRNHEGQRKKNSTHLKKKIWRDEKRKSGVEKRWVVLLTGIGV